MTARREVVLVAGARPNFMKVAPIARALAKSATLTGTIVHTGQHYDRQMSDLFFEQLGIPEPEIKLGVGSGTHAAQTAEVMLRLEPVLVSRRPALVLVVGDVNSTVAAALVASKLGIPVAHVEAGLRSRDRAMPEELNRIVTDALSDLLFVSEPSGLANLAQEGTPETKVHFVGNVMIDTLLRFRDAAARLDMPDRLGLPAKGYAVLTLHRPANVDAPDALRALLDPILELSDSVPVLFPVHPRTRAGLLALGAGDRPGFRLVDPMGYLEFLGAMSAARLVLTDSGGIQEETTVLGVPCVTLRDNTERPSTLTEGTNRLAGTTSAGVRAAISETLDHPREGKVPQLWDGRAAERIVAVLERSLAD
ncbi:MAG TPA: UDP-N-acetylglucosamine 2-epimerase (non-hydrolyzing) [Candidatus Polarisedimenticolaceae bacterium]|nr:UDP-N-acetylglucosamine 2-epimerase (non-hydrolyzing) [Candidatus Polarisedimenticolaceae bacterium]